MCDSQNTTHINSLLNIYLIVKMIDDNDVIDDDVGYGNCSDDDDGDHENDYGDGFDVL